MRKDKKWEREADRYKKSDATFADKFSNFWYYHKYHLLIGVAAIGVLIYLSTSIVLKEDYDYNIIFVTQNPISTEEVSEIQAQIDQEAEPYEENLESSNPESDDQSEEPQIYLYQKDIDYIQKYLESVGDDLNGDGEVEVSINCINIEGNRDTVSEIQTHKEQILTALRTGECMILLGDSVGMDFLYEADALEDLSSFSDTSDYDGRAVFLNPYFSEKIGNDENDIPIYIGLRYFTGTLAQTFDDKVEDFENAKNLVLNILSD